MLPLMSPMPTFPWCPIPPILLWTSSTPILVSSPKSCGNLWHDFTVFENYTLTEKIPKKCGAGGHFRGDGIGAEGRKPDSGEFWRFSECLQPRSWEQLSCSRMPRLNQKERISSFLGKVKPYFWRFSESPCFDGIFREAQKLPSLLGLLLAQRRGGGPPRSLASRGLSRHSAQPVLLPQGSISSTLQATWMNDLFLK